MGFFKVVVLLSLFPLVVSAVECEGTPGCYTLQMLELWKRFKIIDLRFNALELWQRMDVAYKRWSTPEIDLWNASDVFWQKYVEFGIAKGKPGDYWNGTGPFMEFDPTMLVKQTDLEKFPGIDPRAVDVVVLEPCNSVSNIALIRAMLGVSENDQKKKWSIDDPALRGLVQAFSYAGPASFLMHSSGTNVGGIVDNESIHHMALIAHQASLQSLPYDPVLHDLKETPASYSGQQSVAEAFRIFLEEPIADWDTLIKDLDTITYESSFMAILTTGFYMALPQRIASRFVRLFAGFLLSGDSLDFIFESYTPALLAALEDASYGILKRFKIFFGGIGVIVRVLYAFLWQEELIKGKHLTSRTANFLGAVGVRKVNRLANFLTGFNRRNDRKFQRARNVYPGDKRCRRQVPHSKWHEVIANGLVDVAILCDMINRVFSEQRLHFNLDNELFRCYESSSVFSGFDWQSISSTVSQVFETCSVELLDDWPRPDIGQFTGCMISSMIRAGNEEEAESVGEDTVPPLTLDACLVNNDCIKFDGLQLDVDLLKQCVGLTLETRVPQPCSAFVDKPLISMCMMPCGSDPSCSLNCLKQHAEISPWVQQSASCLVILSTTKSNNKPDPALLATCMQESLPEQTATPFQSNMARGMSALASVSLNECGNAFTNFATSAGKLGVCVGTCMQESSAEDGEDTIGSVVIPASFMCLTECALDAL